MISFPDPELAFCARHLEPFRAKWPSGYAILIVRLVGLITEDERFYAGVPKDQNGLGDAELITGRLVKFSPLCCFLGDDTMAMLTRDALHPEENA
jgi:hypothetical protein